MFGACVVGCRLKTWRTRGSVRRGQGYSGTQTCVAEPSANCLATAKGCVSRMRNDHREAKRPHGNADEVKNTGSDVGIRCRGIADERGKCEHRESEPKQDRSDGSGHSHFFRCGVQSADCPGFRRSLRTIERSGRGNGCGSPRSSAWRDRAPVAPMMIARHARATATSAVLAHQFSRSRSWVRVMSWECHGCTEAALRCVVPVC